MINAIHNIEWQTHLNYIGDNPPIDGFSDIVNAIVAVANFIANIASAVVSWCIKVVGAFVSALVNVIKAVVDAVVSVLNAIVDWIIRIISDAVAYILEPITSAIQSFYHALICSFDSGVQEYQQSGTIPNTLVNILDFTWLFGVLFAVVVAIDVLTAALTAATLGIGYIIMSLLSGVLVYLIVDIFTGDTSYNTKDVEGYESNPAWSYILSFAEGWLEGGESTSTKSTLTEGNDQALTFAFFATLFSVFSWIVGTFTMGITDPTGYTAGVVSLALSTIAWWVFGTAAFIAIGAGNTLVGNLLGGGALILGIASLILSIYSLAIAGAVSIGIKIAAGVSAVFAIIATYSGYEAMS